MGEGGLTRSAGQMPYYPLQQLNIWNRKRAYVQYHKNGAKKIIAIKSSTRSTVFNCPATYNKQLENWGFKQADSRLRTVQLRSSDKDQIKQLSTQKSRHGRKVDSSICIKIVKSSYPITRGIARKKTNPPEVGDR